MQKFAFVCLFILVAFSSPASAIFGYGQNNPSNVINLAKQIQSTLVGNNQEAPQTTAPKSSAPKQNTPQTTPKLSDIVNKVFETLRKQEEGDNQDNQVVTPTPQDNTPKTPSTPVVEQNTATPVVEKNTTTPVVQENTTQPEQKPTIPVVQQNTTKAEESTAAPVVQNTTTTTTEVPKTNVPKEASTGAGLNSPSPQCLSVTYQALSILYSFGADAASQDISQLQVDYTSLNPIIQGINNFCNPKVAHATQSRVGYQDCSVDLNAINGAFDSFKSGDPTDYMNVIQTVQSLWNLKDNFTADCSSMVPKKTQPITINKPAFQEPKTCESFYSQAFFKLSKISEDAAVNDLVEILKGFNSLKSIIVNINQFCPANLHIQMFPKQSSTKGVCSEHFVEMRKVVASSRVSALKDLSNTLQKVWNMAPLFLHDC